MKVNRLWCMAWVGAALAAPTLAAEFVEAEFVEISSTDLVLVRASELNAVVALERGATLTGLTTPQALRRGDRVRYRAARTSDGISYATVFELLPAIATDPDLVIDLGELVQMLSPGQPSGRARPLLVDLRDAGAFARGHLPGAVSAAGWEANLASVMPFGKEASVILYGRSRQDGEAVDALRVALRLGYRNVRLYAGGYREWSDGNRVTFVGARDLSRRIGVEPLVVLDVRSPSEAARGSLPRSVSIVPNRLRSSEWINRPGMPVLVVVGRDADDPTPHAVAEAIRLWQPGTDSIPPGTIQILEGGFAAWVAVAGAIEPPRDRLDDVPCTPLPGEACPDEFLRLWREEGRPLLLDVRTSAAFRPQWAKHLPLGELPSRLAELPRDREIVVFCGRGITSRVAQGVLERAGFKARFVRLPAPRKP